MIGRDRLINSALTVVTVIVVLLVFEASLQMGFVGSQPTIEQSVCSNHDRVYSTNLSAGRTKAPGLVYSKRYPGDVRHRYEINENGFRDTFDSGQGENILVFGDSFTYGVQAGQRSTYPYYLDRWTPDTSVRNYGMPGWGTANQMSLYDSENFSDHQVVVLGYYLGNDPIDNLYRTPQYRLSNGSLQRLSGQVRTPPERQRWPGLGQTGQFLRENTATYPFVTSRVAALLMKTGVHRPAWALPPKGDTRRKSLELTRALLDRLADEVRENNASLVITIIPERGVVNTSNPNRQFQSNWNRYSDEQREMLMDFAASHDNVSIVDMKRPLKKEVENGRSVYGPINGHLDDYGYYIVAKELHSHLSSNGYVEKRAIPAFPGEQSQDCSDV